MVRQQYWNNPVTLNNSYKGKKKTGDDGEKKILRNKNPDVLNG